MGQKEEYDFIIAGAGASGLSLLWYIIQSSALSDRSILLIDRKLSPNDEKTWCFWDDHQMPFGDLIYHTWPVLEVSALGNHYTGELQKYEYNCIRSAEYSSKILALAKKTKNVTLIEADINGFQAKGNSGILHSSEGSFSASWIFQSVLKSPALKEAKSDISLKQHFLGWEIRTENPIFDPDKAILMDFEIPQSNGVTFFYVLPFSEHDALIEYTLFSDSVLFDAEYESSLKKYMFDKFNLSEKDYTLVRKEKGVIPMEDRRYPGMYCDRVVNIGIQGGLTKPSTGYTFTRIHRHSAGISKALEKGLPPPAGNSSGYRFRVYDIMLLYLLQNHPETSVRIFSELFKRNSFDRILQFLEEQTHPGQELSIFSSLPYYPFFKAIYKMKHRIFTGA
jgi:lycopene beta-cyclase